MNHQEILSRVDHTILTTTATWEQVKQVCSCLLYTSKRVSSRCVSIILTVHWVTDPMTAISMKKW